jgi:hypothetical protein
MHARSAIKWGFVFAVLALAAGPAGAQTNPATGDQGQPAQPPPSSVSVTPPSATAEGQVGFQRKPTLTFPEMLTEGDGVIKKVTALKAEVKKSLDEAQKQRDVVKTLCLQDKHSQIEAGVETAKGRNLQLKNAVTLKDSELSNHHLTVMIVIRQRVEQNAAEANQCIGEESAFVGDTRTSVQINPEIPPDEAPYPVTDPSQMIGNPQCVSCTQ